MLLLEPQFGQIMVHALKLMFGQNLEVASIVLTPGSAVPLTIFYLSSLEMKYSNGCLGMYVEPNQNIPYLSMKQHFFSLSIVLLLFLHSVFWSER